MYIYHFKWYSQAIDFLADDPLGPIPRKTSRTVEMTTKIEVLPDETGFHRIIFLKFKMALLVKLTRPEVLEDSERVCVYDVAYNSHKHCRVRWYHGWVGSRCDPKKWNVKTSGGVSSSVWNYDDSHRISEDVRSSQWDINSSFWVSQKLSFHKKN